MNCRDFGIEDKSSTGFFELSIYGRHECLEKNRGGGGRCERLRVSVIMICLVVSKESLLLALSCRAFARLLLADLELML